MAGKNYRGSRRDGQKTPLMRRLQQRATTPPEPWWMPFTGDRHEDLEISWQRS